ncbi:pyrroloquinoline quinone biosynthesis protein PqqB [Rhodopseudomonas palustris]|uniref:pyrroloquinoline quinone biosynthesis protein PqqB n=1 Tax=Rhodopseudomonas palustris TaxID=1076 RepID=UPI00115F42F7|nr:pyrroloquinoline quinone biosynthesis protein PqqB [Rhodopseudomonas palustris]QDL96834.1 pyrroloquinoline quinone biosynthesis protein PqqB [Rhodopseudomonas palustris]
MLRVIVLGAAAGGGVPQWNCGCPGCRAAFADAELRRTQASVAVSSDGEHWFLINASPDLRQQIIATPQLHPRAGALRHSPIAGVILTNGEVDAVAGLLSMREGSPFTIYAHAKVLAILKANSIFNVLNEKLVARQPIAIDQPIALRLPDGVPSGLEVSAFAVPGKGAWYLEGQTHPGGADGEGDTLGLSIIDTASDQTIHVLTACARVTDELKARLAGAPLVLFDGTVWRDDELIAAGLGTKTGQAMGHIAMAGDHGAIAALSELGIAEKLFVHVNNSNPALLAHSTERRQLETAGWQIPADGTEVTL